MSLSALVPLFASAATLALVSAPFSAAAAPILYSISNPLSAGLGPPVELHTVDAADGSTLSSVEVTLSGSVLVSSNGLTRDPLSGGLWAVLTAEGAGKARELVTLDPITGIASSVGTISETGIAGITFDSSGVLYGVTGDGANVPETLWTIDTTDATATSVLTLGNGDDGEAIAFNPDDGLIYHSSGLGPPGDPTKIFESIDPALVVTSIPLSGGVAGNDEWLALLYNPMGGDFFVATLDEHLLTVTTDGAESFVSQLDHRSKGLAFVAPIPEPGSAVLFGVGALIGAAALRRNSMPSRFGSWLSASFVACGGSPVAGIRSATRSGRRAPNSPARSPRTGG